MITKIELQKILEVVVRKNKASAERLKNEDWPARPMQQVLGNFRKSHKTATGLQQVVLLKDNSKFISFWYDNLPGS